MLAGRKESGDASSPFFPFVSPPGSPADQFCTAGPLTTRGQPPNRDPKLVFFFAGSASEAKAFGRGENWWREFWDDETHAVFAAVGVHMGSKLRKVARHEHCVGYVSWIVFHSGRSPSGADVGVLSTMTIGR